MALKGSWGRTNKCALSLQKSLIYRSQALTESLSWLEGRKKNWRKKKWKKIESVR